MSVANFFGESPIPSSNVVIGGGTDEFSGQVQTIQGTITITSTGSTRLFVITTSSNHAYLFDTIVQARVTAGPDIGKTYFQRALSAATNTNGGINVNGEFSSFTASNGVAGAQSVTQAGNLVAIHFTNSTAGDTTVVFYYAKVYFN